MHFVREFIKYLIYCILISAIFWGLYWGGGQIWIKEACASYGWPDGRFGLEADEQICIFGESEVPLYWLQAGRDWYEYKDYTD